MTASDDRPARRAPADRVGHAGRRAARRLRRETHQPDYSILLAVVALAAIGILMVYLVVGDDRRTLARRRRLRDRRPADLLGRARPRSRCSAMMRVDYRWLRLRLGPGVRRRDRPAGARVRAGRSARSSAVRRAGS